jgi:cephalosporin-C deacetylase-like acetyl esterase
VERLSFVDRARVCIWGWSFGGYLAAMALAEDARTNRQALVDKLSLRVHYKNRENMSVED